MNLKIFGAATLAAACVFNSSAFAEPAAGQPATEAVVHPAEPVPAIAVTPIAPQPEIVPAEAPAAAAPPCCKLAALMPIDLEIVTAASSKTSHQGEQIEIRVAQAVVVDGRVVIPAGTNGYAEVIQVSHRSVGGKPGELTLGQPYLTLRGQRIGLKRLRYGWTSPADRTQQAEIAMALIGIAGGLFTGGSVDIKSGTRANAVLIADTFIPVEPNPASKE